MKSNKLNKKRQLIFFISTVVLSLCVMLTRFFQLKYSIDKVTGYYINGSKSVIFLYGFMAIFVIMLALALIYISKRNITLDIPLKPQNHYLIFKLASYLLFVALTYCGIAALFGSGKSLQQMLTPATIIFVALYVFLLIYVIAVAFDINLQSKNVNLVLSLAPVLWFLTVLIETFFRYTGVANISEHIFELLMLASFILFFLSVAKTAFVKDNNKSTFIYGIISVFLSAIYVIPEFFNLVTNHLDNENIMNSLSVVVFDFCIALLILAIIAPHKKAKMPRDNNVSEQLDDINDLDNLKNHPKVNVDEDVENEIEILK
ncbi:MAG: hypothetical protein RR436_03030 [Clostridia bacterium]